MIDVREDSALFFVRDGSPIELSSPGAESESRSQLERLVVELLVKNQVVRFQLRDAHSLLRRIGDLIFNCRPHSCCVCTSAEVLVILHTILGSSYGDRITTTENFDPIAPVAEYRAVFSD